MRVEEPLHLVAQPRAPAPAATPDWSHAQPAHEPGERRAQNQFAGLGPHGLSADPGQQKAREIAEGQPGWTHSRHDQGERAVDALVLIPVAGIGAGQGTQHHQPRHETRVGVGQGGSHELLHLVEAGEMAACLGRGFVERLHEPLPAREDSPGGSVASGGQTG